MLALQDALTKTIPMWAAVVNRAVKRLKADNQPLKEAAQPKIPQNAGHRSDATEEPSASQPLVRVALLSTNLSARVQKGDRPVQS